MKLRFLKKYFVASVLLIICTTLHSQEMLSGLEVNRLVKLSFEQPDQFNRLNNSYLTIPFKDDFSNSHVYPNAGLWSDQNVFVNNDFAINPPNSGAATFDVLDQTGKVYSTASYQLFVADYLTSNIIRLDSVFLPEIKNISPADSVYFSFYYQIQGRGDRPEKGDSLVLQFGHPSGNMVFDYIDSVSMPVDVYLFANGVEAVYPGDTLYAPDGCNQNLYLIVDRMLTWGDDVTLPCDTVLKPEIIWNRAWSVAGVSIADTVIPRSDVFKQILIPITDPKYFVPDFQFRFYNYGSIASNNNPGNKGNVDQWNLDYVYLNMNRSKSDSTYKQVSFSNRAPSFLKRYESMPYKQYRSDPTNAMKLEFEMNITNLDDVTHQTHYWYSVTQQNGNQYYTYDGGVCDLLPVTLGGFQSCSSCGAFQACPPVNSLFALQTGIDSTSFVIRHFVSDSSGSNRLVDSLLFHQGFYNYFAYDDGTPELGYGLEPAGASVAVQFKMATPDTLKAVQLYFNRTLNDANYKYFDIVVWGDNNGKPGAELYRKSQQHPLWTDDLYGFSLYSFSNPIIVSGIFYVGLYQSEMGSLNIGYDAVNNNSQYTFYDIDNQWYNSQFEGSLMIRPIVGSNKLIGIIENNRTSEPSVSISPNPSSSHVSITINDVNGFIPKTIQLTDLTGRKLFSKQFDTYLNISALDAGIYFLQVIDENQKIISTRLMVAR